MWANKETVITLCSNVITITVEIPFLNIYHEAEQHDSMKSGCCQHFCLRNKLLL